MSKGGYSCNQVHCVTCDEMSKEVTVATKYIASPVMKAQQLTINHGFQSMPIMSRISIGSRCLYPSSGWLNARPLVIWQ